MPIPAPSAEERRALERVRVQRVGLPVQRAPYTHACLPVRVGSPVSMAPQPTTGCMMRSAWRRPLLRPILEDIERLVGHSTW